VRRNQLIDCELEIYIAHDDFARSTPSNHFDKPIYQCAKSIREILRGLRFAGPKYFSENPSSFIQIEIFRRISGSEFGAIIAHMKSSCRGIPILSVALLVGVIFTGQAAVAQAATPRDDAQALVKQGQELNNAGKLDEALKLYKQALEKSPNSYEAHLESGLTLDLKGDYAAAREHLKKAIELAPADEKNRTLRVMAFSYVFERNAVEAEKYEKQVFDALTTKSDFEAAAGVANELARIKLELGDVNGAASWYKTGYDTAMRKTEMKDADKNLWAFRWAHAQARIAARRGHPGEAQRQVTTAKTALAKANNQDQARFFPYLTGYVAFYSGDYKAAIAELEKANQEDPFILMLLAQSYEKVGDAARAKEYYGRVMANNGHGLTNALARPVARGKLAGG
jgi:tetratricopeptide (TPR) repeat protein